MVRFGNRQFQCTSIRIAAIISSFSIQAFVHFFGAIIGLLDEVSMQTHGRPFSVQ